jgi:CBS domain containing-hemolysin-like protein
MIAALLLLLLGLVLTAAIIAANGYFVAQEFAYMSVDRAKLRARAETGDVAARRALAVTRRTSFMLSGAQLGITVTGLMVGYVAEPFIGESIGVLLGGAGVPVAVGITIGTVGALVLATVVQMIFGELYPKNLALASPEPLSRRLARSTLVYLTVFGWLIRFFDASSNAVLRLLQVKPVHDVDSSATSEDLEHIIEDSRVSGDLPEELSVLLDRILDFPERDVEHAMIPRVRVDVVRPTTTVGEVRALMARAHTRYPVISERDELEGVVHLADVLMTAADDVRPVSAIMREPLVVPTLMRLTDALENLMHTRNELACVIDEYGGFAGVVTVEDLAEELVGEIADEHDPHDVAGAAMDADGVWVIDGDVHIDEVERVAGRDLPRGDYETIAGLVIATAGRLPGVGEIVFVELPVVGSDVVELVQLARALEIEIVEIERHVPRTVRVTLRADPIDEAVHESGLESVVEPVESAHEPVEPASAFTADDEVGR